MSNYPTKKLGDDQRPYVSTCWDINKTEAEWIEATDSFFLKYTPQWFKFVGWLILLGVLKYIEQITRSKLIGLIYAFSFLGLYFYLQALLFNFPFFKFLPPRFIRARGFAFIFSITTAGLLLFLLHFYLLEKIITDLSIK